MLLFRKAVGAWRICARLAYVPTLFEGRPASCRGGCLLNLMHSSTFAVLISCAVQHGTAVLHSVVPLGLNRACLAQEPIERSVSEKLALAAIVGVVGQCQSDAGSPGPQSGAEGLPGPQLGPR